MPACIDRVPDPLAPTGRDFLGRRERRVCIGQVELSDMRPTVPAEDVAPHTHEDAHFLLLLAGDYVSSADGMPPVCAERALIVNPPGTHHRDRFAGRDGRFVTVAVPHARWEATGLSCALRPRRLCDRALVTATRAWSEMRLADSAAPLVLEGLVASLLDHAATPEKQPAAPAPAWLERAAQRMDDDWADAPSMATLAALAQVHPVHFSRAFRRRYGCAPGAYLRARRLQVALGLLHDRRERIADIATRCGFVDQAHFTRLFRERYRLTPARYRRLAGLPVH